MNISDLVKQCNCKYARFGRDNPESTTVWLWCALKRDDEYALTDVSSCKKCSKRVTKGAQK